jgi:hypothetical protein
MRNASSSFKCLWSHVIEKFRHVFIESGDKCLGFVEFVGRKCPTSSVHGTGFCILTKRHATRIHGFLRCLTKKRWWLYLSSVLLHPRLLGLFWFSKTEETLFNGWRFKDIMKTKLNRRQHWNASQNVGDQRCFQLRERHWVMYLNQEGAPFEWDGTKMYLTWA